MAASGYGATSPPIRAQGSSSSALPHAFPYADLKNTILYPGDADQQFSLAEGLYQLRDSVLLAEPQPNPVDRQLQTNVLDTKPVLPISGVKISLAAQSTRRPTSGAKRPVKIPKFRNVFSSTATDISQDSSQDGSEEASSRSDTYGWPGVKSKFGEGNPALVSGSTKESKDPLKRRKPKGAVTKGHSSFIARAIPHDNFSKRLQEHQSDGVYALANINRAVYWLDFLSTSKQDQLSKIVFTRAQAMCHDFNDCSKTFQHLDYVVGFNTGDIIWLEAISQKYSHLNKNGIVHPSPVSQIRWLPGSENLFIAAHLDGSLTIYDKEKDDASFVLEENAAAALKVSVDGRRLPRLVVKKSVQSRNQKTNPLAFWKATNQRINDMAFSTDGKLLALACEDGSLRIIDYLKEELIDLYRGYYGGLTCLAWSPDGEYIITGGQDDLISVWSLEDRALVARCLGHKSWIACVTFDPWRCDDTTYRFGSVGEDGRMLFWDFSVGMLNQPRTASIRQDSVSNGPSGERSDSVVTMTQEMVSSGANEQESGEDSIAHPILSRAAVATLPPILSKPIDEKHALSWLRFEEDSIIAACKNGHIFTWDRPKDPSSLSDGHAS